MRPLDAPGWSRRRWGRACAGLLAASLVRQAGAQPGGALRLMVAYPPGGVSDEVARLLADRLALLRGAPVRVEYKPGAGGSIAMEHLARSPPDGRLLLFCAITPLTLMPRYQPVRYLPLRDIAPVAAVMATPTLVAGTAALQATDFAGLLSRARAAPGALRWATTGVGTTGYRVLEAVGQALSLDLTHVPYKGGGQSLQDALGAQFEVLSTNVAPAQLQYVAQGRLKALAVGAAQRVPELPDVPTLAELGVPAGNLSSLFGLFAPGGTPRAWRDAWNAEVHQVLQQPDLRQRLRDGHNAVGEAGVAAFEARICAEMSDATGLAGGCRWRG